MTRQEFLEVINGSGFLAQTRDQHARLYSEIPGNPASRVYLTDWLLNDDVAQIIIDKQSGD